MSKYNFESTGICMSIFLSIIRFISLCRCNFISISPKSCFLDIQNLIPVQLFFHLFPGTKFLTQVWYCPINIMHHYRSKILSPMILLRCCKVITPSMPLIIKVVSRQVPLGQNARQVKAFLGDVTSLKFHIWTSEHRSTSYQQVGASLSLQPYIYIDNRHGSSN
jgi:hypothetical protein